MSAPRAVNAEPIPGYRLLEPLGKGGCGEVWKCEAPGGLLKAVKFIAGDPGQGDGSGCAVEVRSLQQLKTIRHPFLLAMERVEIIDGDLVIVMELADRSLHDVLQSYRRAGRPGIPRGQLLGYLREAAEALDVMNVEHGLQHLDVKPRNLFLVGQHIKVADYGLIKRPGTLQDNPERRARDAVSPLYAAPEVFLGRISRACDQYSLAVTWCELLSGTLPFAGSNFRQLALAHLRSQPDLEGLPKEDRTVVARALAREPDGRFPSCLAFIRALEAVPAGPVPLGKGPHSDYEMTPGDMSQTQPVHLPHSATTQPSLPGTTGLVPGHHLLERVARLPTGEAWKGHNDQGEKRLIKLVLAPEPVEGTPDPTVTLLQIRHDTLAPLEIIPCPGRRLALITDPGECSLCERLKQCQQEGQSGIPRLELLSQLRPVAEALDALLRTHRLQHLYLTPRQIVLRDGKVRLLDFGLVELLWQPSGHEAPGINTRYCAPELFARQTSRSCDQYSLALIYQEMLTGVHPFRNLNPRQMAQVKYRGQPDVGLLSSTERPIVLRALNVDPDKRYRSCTDFIAALEDVATELRGSLSPTGTSVATVRVGPVAATPPAEASPAPAAPPAPAPPPAVEMTPLASWSAGASAQPASATVQAAVVAEVGRLARDAIVRSSSVVRYILRCGEGAGREEPCLEAHCFGRLLPSTAPLKLQGFLAQWQADVEATHGGTSESSHSATFACFVRTGGSIWQRCLGRRPGLEVRLDLLASPTMTGGLTGVRIRIVPRGMPPERAVQVLDEIGPPLLESLRNYLQLYPERRTEERLTYPVPLQVHTLMPTGEVGPAAPAHGKNITTQGLSLFLPCRPPMPSLSVHLPSAQDPHLYVPSRVVRAHVCPDGRVEVGLRWAWEEA